MGACPGMGRVDLSPGDTRASGPEPPSSLPRVLARPRCRSAGEARQALLRSRHGERAVRRPPHHSRIATHCWRRPSPPSLETGFAPSRAGLPGDPRSRPIPAPIESRNVSSASRWLNGQCLTNWPLARDLHPTPQQNVGHYRNINKSTPSQWCPVCYLGINQGTIIIFLFFRCYF